MSDLVDVIGAKLVLSLGSVATGAPHTRPVNVSGSANNSQLAERYNMHPSRFEGPSGIVGVFHDHCRRRDVGGVSLWASVPHYLPGIANPVGAEALLRVVNEMTDLHLDFEPLDRAIQRFHSQLDEVLSENAELREYVSQLEAAMPGPPGPNPQAERGASDLPSADALIEDLENFLRRRPDDDN